MRERPTNQCHRRAATLAPPQVHPGLPGIIAGLLLAILLLLALPAQAIATERRSAPPPFDDQATLIFNRLSVKDGLVFPSVRSLLQDQRGFLWVGTAAGPSRYDGYSFTNYSSERETPTELRTANIMAWPRARTG